MRKPFRDKYGVWIVEDKPAPRNLRFDREVELKVARSAGVGGWAKGPVFIIEQAQDEQIDTPAWLTGLDQYEKPPGAADLIAEIGEDAAGIFEKIERLRCMYDG